MASFFSNLRTQLTLREFKPWKAADARLSGRLQMRRPGLSAALKLKTVHPTRCTERLYKLRIGKKGNAR